MLYFIPKMNVLPGEHTLRPLQHVDETMSHYVATLCRRNLVLTRFTAHFTNTLLTKGLLTKGEAEELS